MKSVLKLLNDKSMQYSQKKDFVSENAYHKAIKRNSGLEFLTLQHSYQKQLDEKTIDNLTLLARFHDVNPKMLDCLYKTPNNPASYLVRTLNGKMPIEKPREFKDLGYNPVILVDLHRQIKANYEQLSNKLLQKIENSQNQNQPLYEN